MAENRNAVSLIEEFAAVHDIPLQITFEVGRRSMQVREILRMKPDSVVEIDKAAGENVDVYVNGKLVAFGEILDVENRAGVRLTDFPEQD